jgi:hypothetical protein
VDEAERDSTTAGAGSSRSNRVVVKGSELLAFIQHLLKDGTVATLILGNQQERILEIPVPHAQTDIGDLPGYTTLCALTALPDEFVIDVIHKDLDASRHDG